MAAKCSEKTQSSFYSAPQPYSSKIDWHKVFSSVILINPSEIEVDEHISLFNSHHTKEPKIHEVAVKNLRENSFDFTDPFPRVESHGHYLFGEFATPTSLIDGKDLFITTHLIVSFTRGLLIFRTPNGSPIEKESNSFNEFYDRLLSTKTSGGRFIIDLITFIVCDYENKISEVHEAIDSGLLSLTKSFEELGRKVTKIDVSSFYHLATLFNIDVVGCQSSINGSLMILGEISNDEVDLRITDERGSNELFTRDLEIEVSDLQIRVRHLQSLRQNLQLTLDMTFKKFEKIEELRQTQASHNMTAVASMMLLPSFLVGFFGQNFKLSDRLNFHSGWFISISLIVLVSIGQFIFFRRKNWL